VNTHELNDGMSRITSQWKVFLCAALPFDDHVICSGVVIGQQLTNPLLPSRCMYCDRNIVNSFTVYGAYLFVYSDITTNN